MSAVSVAQSLLDASALAMSRNALRSAAVASRYGSSSVPLPLSVSAASAAGMRPTSSVSTSSRARNRFFMCFPPKTKKFCPPESADRCSKTSRTKFLRSAMQLPVPAEMPAAFGYSDLSAFRRLHSDRLAGLFTRIPPAARSGEDCAIYSFGRSVSQPGAVVNPFSDRIRGRSARPAKRRTPAPNTQNTPGPKSGGALMECLFANVSAEDGGHLGAGHRVVRREELAVAADDELSGNGPLQLSLRPGRNVRRVAER